MTTFQHKNNSQASIPLNITNTDSFKNWTFSVYAPLAYTSFMTLALVLKWSNNNKKQQTNQTFNGKQNKAVVWYTYNQHNKFFVLLWQQHICYSCPSSYNNNSNSAQALFLLQTPLCPQASAEKERQIQHPLYWLTASDGIFCLCWCFTSVSRKCWTAPGMSASDFRYPPRRRWDTGRQRLAQVSAQQT